MINYTFTNILNNKYPLEDFIKYKNLFDYIDKLVDIGFCKITYD